MSILMSCRGVSLLPFRNEDLTKLLRQPTDETQPFRNWILNSYLDIFRDLARDSMQAAAGRASRDRSQRTITFPDIGLNRRSRPVQRSNKSAWINR